MYLVTCLSCATTYDATQVPECSCLQPVRSFACPTCGGCFCKAGSSVLEKFWRNAPAELWQKRRERNSRNRYTGAQTTESPETISRPMVLFADDDPVGRLIATTVIRALGYGIAVAENGEQALKMALEYHPELIITDALMPRLDGREMSRIVKQELPNTKVVVITSVYKDARYKYEAMREFFVDEFLRKPVNPEELRATIEKYVGAPQPRRA